MRKFIQGLILLLLLYILFVNKVLSQCSGTLVWADEFSGTSLDLTKWSYDIGNGCPSLCGWGNNELEYYTNSTNNVRVTGGNLIIEARSQSMGGSQFTSGKIKTLGLASWTYGRFEARMRLPQGRGLWPAFWMLNDNNNWPMTGEIDIMEYRGDYTNRTAATLHYGSPWPNNQHDGTEYTLPTGNFYSEWHVFAVEWEANEIRWYLDDIRIKTETRTPNSLNPGSSNDPWPWDENFYFILNLAVGGWFPGVTSPADVQLTKPTFEIDYVRVYDISASAGGQSPYWGTPVTFPGRVQAEEFDRGCGDAAYSDQELVNQGGQFRQEKVDIEATSDAGGGYNVGWNQTGEWMEYTVNVPSNGTYNFVLRAASGTGGGRVRIEMDGVTLGAPVNINNTGGWQNWQNFNINNVALSSGTKVMRIYVESAGFNLNYIDVAVNTLPVTWGTFNAFSSGEGVSLYWTTKDEVNNAFFEIEQSNDGHNWTKVGGISGQGTSHSDNAYHFFIPGIKYDNQYFRIRQVDEDGSFSYTQVVSVEVETNLELIVGSDMIEVKGLDPSEINLKIYSPDGKLLSQSESSTISKPNKMGVYIIHITSGNQFHRKKIFL